MSIRPSRRSLAVLATTLAALSMSAPAYAKGGTSGGGGGTGGGGGGTTTVGVINRASAGAVCTGGTVMSISVDKGFNKRVELQISYSNGPTGLYQNFVLANDATGTNTNKFGSFPSSPGGLITHLGGTVPAGPVELSYTYELRSDSFTGPVVETCTAHISTTAR